VEEPARTRLPLPEVLTIGMLPLWQQFQPGNEVFGKKRFGGADHAYVLELIYVYANSSH
jgi:hypothetical protein